MDFKTKNTILLSLVGAFVPTLARDSYSDLEPVPIYTEPELIRWTELGTHLQQVKSDDCQLVEDIVARATRINLPSYQFLYGDMLINGTCVEQQIKNGVYYITEAAEQGLPVALYKLGLMYSEPKYLQRNDQRAIAMLEEASIMGFVPASILWAELLLKGRGSPIDYPKVYKDLQKSISVNDTHHHIESLIKQIRQHIPENFH